MNKIISYVFLLSLAGSLCAQEHALISSVELNPEIVMATTIAMKNCNLRHEVIDQLNEAQKDLEKFGLSLKVLEAHCQPCQDEFIETVEGTMIPTPEECKRHCLGTCVDVTLVDSEGNELEMPCAFDEFGEQAKRSCMQASDEALYNRDMLENVMIRNGFISSENNWWHFDIKNWQKYACQEAVCTRTIEDCQAECMQKCESEYLDQCQKSCQTECPGTCENN